MSEHPDVESPHHIDFDPLDAKFNCLDTVIALYDFPGIQSSHLPLELGDTVYILSKSESGWWDGVLLNSEGELCRGWIPCNYVRSVNYVQPVLDKMQTNKEIDSLTAANTAANVLIPSFRNLLQKGLDTPSGRDSSSNTRKNSVVSFASSETSLEAKTRKSEKEIKDAKDLNLKDLREEDPLGNPIDPLAHHQPSFASTLSYGTGSASMSCGSGSASGSVSHLATPPERADKIVFTSVEDAESAVAQLKEADGKNSIWIPRMTDEGEIVYYCELLDMFCSTLPLTPMIPAVDYHGISVDIPSRDATEDVSVVLRQYPAEFYGGISAIDMTSSSRSSSLVKSLEGSAKRDSSASTMSQGSASSYHNFSQPFFITPGLFYSQFADIDHWTELREQSNYLLDLIWKALENSSKQLFTLHLSELTRTVSSMMNAARLTQADFRDTRIEKSIRHRMRKVTSAFAQMYINSLLHLSMMHYSEGSVGDEYLNLGIHNLNKSTSTTCERPSASSRGSDSTFIQVGAQSSKDSLSSHSISGDEGIVSYLHQIENDIAKVRSKMNSLINSFIKLSRDKRVFARDYDNSDVSEDEGEDRFNLLPQVNPRFIANEFNGGNWCNPFFTETHKSLNLSGDLLKNKYHSKIIIDTNAYERASAYSGDIKKFTHEILDLLDPAKQNRYYNDALKSDRNERILRVMYKYLHHASHLVDLLESLDFTVFCLVNRHATSVGSDESAVDEMKIRSVDSNLTFEYPFVLDFFRSKQHFHDSLAKLITNVQALTLEDPDTFASMKEDDFTYSREAMKDPLEKSALLLSQILLKQLGIKQDERITFDQDLALYGMLINGTVICDDLLVHIKQLVDERETILNYSTRVMHDNFNMELLLAERENTSAGLKAEDTAGQYYVGDRKSADTPWFLEGDEQFDLLLDKNGSIKGGTKEALVAHLTHHSTLDNPFNTVFMVSFSTIMSISELLDLLISRFEIEAPEGLSYEEYLQWLQKKQNLIRLKVLNVMKSIAENHWSDSFSSKSVFSRWLLFLNRSEVQAYPITKRLQEDVQKLKVGEIVVPVKPLGTTEKAPAPLVKSFSLRKMRLLDIEYVELARQLTLREFSLYCNISKLACIHKVWGKRSGVDESISSIQNFIRSSNQLTNFVAYSILRKDDPRRRVKVIRYFVQVAEWCRQYNNFSSMTAIISALYSSPIHRLKKTWAYVTKDTLNRLQSMNKLMNSSRNFNEYRDMLKFIGAEPCVPFFGVYLSDLTFVYHGNPDHVLNRSRMINFSKRVKTVEIVTGIDRFKQVHYNFHAVPEIQTFIDLWFDKCPTIDEQYQLSLNIEPRQEKVRDAAGLAAGRQVLSIPGR